jgi:beta-barrel assembly-enhancing protease
MKRIYRLTITVLVFSLAFTSIVFSREARNRISSMIDESSLLTDVQAEIKFGRDLAARILGNYSVLNDEKINKYVNLVGAAVALYSGRPEIKYYFAVLNSKEINAFAAPGGYVFITNGALMAIENEAQLAAVLGHEIAHIEKKHVVKELKIKGEDVSAVGGIGSIIGGATGTLRVVLEQVLDNASNILLKRGYKINDEIEADTVGLLMAYMAGYDPSALKDLLIKVNNFEPEDKTYKGEHPIQEVRINEINKSLEANGLKSVKKAKLKGRFNEYVKK